MKIIKDFVIVAKRFVTTCIVIVITASMSSCLKDNNEVFDENSSTRMTEYLDSAKKVLTSGNATWLMEMYPSSSQMLGGYVFTFRFTADSVYCRTEMADATAEVGSLWRTTRDDGPVLSLDTYNSFAHLLSTPSAKLYQGYYGEFEWVITDVEQDLVTLRGKKTGNTIYLRRLTETPEKYLDDVAFTREAILFSGLEGTIGGDSVRVAIDTDYRQVTFTADTASYSTAYCVTADGISFYKPVSINGKEITGMTSDYDAVGSMSGMTTSAGDKFVAVYPEDYLMYGDFIGDYTLYYYLTIPGGYKHVDVSLEPAVSGKTFYLKGLNPYYDLEVDYKKSTGTIEICSQIALDSSTHQPYKSVDGYYIGCIAWYATSATAGYVSYMNTVGMTGKLNTKNEKETEIAFSDNGVWQSGYLVNSFKFYYFNDTSFSDKTRVGGVSRSEEYIQGTYNSNSMPFVKVMVKK